MSFLSFYKYLDWRLILSAAVIAVAGLLSLWSSAPDFFYRQLLWLVLGFILVLNAPLLRWRTLITNAWFRYGLYIFSAGLLLLTHFQSATIRGTKAWLVIGDFQFEPAELAKLAIILVLADFFARRHLSAWQGKNLLVSMLILGIPLGLVFFHPDFGSAFILGFIWLVFLLIGGIHARRFILGALMAVLVFTGLWLGVLKDYQKDRVSAFLFPEKDPLGINYNVIQSKIAIGSAGFWGKGFGAGTQVQQGYLPESQTDFLFAAFVEEWGLAGGLLIFGAWLFMLYRIMRIGLKLRDNFGKLVCVGASAYFMAHFLVNVGSNLGLVPVAGVTFPFLSYGGSSVLTTCLILSIIENIQLESSV